MIVPVNLKDNVSPAEYELRVLESYAPIVRRLADIEGLLPAHAAGFSGLSVDCTGREPSSTWEIKTDFRAAALEGGFEAWKAKHPVVPAEEAVA